MAAIEILSEPRMLQEPLMVQRYKPMGAIARFIGMPEQEDGPPVPTGFAGRTIALPFKARGVLLLVGVKMSQPVIYRDSILRGVLPISYDEESGEYTCVCDYIEEAIHAERTTTNY